MPPLRIVRPTLLGLLALTLAVVGCGHTLTSDGAGEGDADSPMPPPPSPPGPELTATPGATASPTPVESPAVAAGTYLALGDSLAVGVGASDPERLGYVGRLDAAHDGLELVNVAVSGETSQSMRGGGQLSEAVRLIRTARPAVSLVTLDIGGNDLLRLLASEPCSSQPESDECRGQLALTLLEFEGNYRQILGQLRAALDASAPRARLAVMTYFNPFSGTDAAYVAAGELALLGQDGEVDCPAAETADSRGMNDIIACVAVEHGARVADVKPLFDGLGLELTHIGAQDIHANDAGYLVIARELAAAIGSDPERLR